MDLLDRIPVTYFETVGTFVGLFACSMIALQVVREWRLKTPSSLSLGYLVGWILIFFFWWLYGIRFNTFAILVSNAIATTLQTILLIVVLRKRKRSSQS
ncbi:MAG TPA: hypothetical protein P5275_08440 [Saprospiraceae bacterium]|nr:hypothetical protein [Saprospiraceae bacterium]HPG08488.1 hypothetical protein [Saprospiraceae bacterium]HRV84874.1 hypothetical protein [Saprospiraceae bacterium]